MFTSPAGVELSQHWVQVEEVNLAGALVGEGPVQRLFAPMTCSKRCAVAVLAAEVSAEVAVRNRILSLTRSAPGSCGAEAREVAPRR
jgi:hypothetical protein